MSLPSLLSAHCCTSNDHLSIKLCGRNFYFGIFFWWSLGFCNWCSFSLYLQPLRRRHLQVFFFFFYFKQSRSVKHITSLLQTKSPKEKTAKHRIFRSVYEKRFHDEKEQNLRSTEMNMTDIMSNNQVCSVVFSCNCKVLYSKNMTSFLTILHGFRSQDHKVINRFRWFWLKVTDLCIKITGKHYIIAVIWTV